MKGSVIPYKNDFDLSLTQTYIFNGFSQNISDTTEVTVAPPALVNRDLNLYATFKQGSVYNNVLRDSKYYTVHTFSDNGKNYTALNLTPLAYKLEGKITLPKEVDGKIINYFNESSDSAGSSINNRPSKITHIFWEEGSSLNTVGIYACAYWDNLRYFEIPNPNTTILGRAFL